MVRLIFILFSVIVLLVNFTVSFFYPLIWWDMIVFGPLILIGVADMLQTKQAIRRNFPILGNLRYFLEMVRPEINQYFVESNSSGRPFSREDRSVVYQRSKDERDTIPFGTQKDIYETGYEWVNHSIVPVENKPEDLRVKIGGDQCTKPYSASVLNISAMSFGSMSKNAILALNEGAKLGNFAHNTGEGGLSPYHLQGGGDLVWQIGTGYFSCRTSDGNFSSELFRDNACRDNVKMIEIKISQGAKPGGGGIMPGIKVTQEIADIRGVPVGKTVHSPSKHKTFNTPIELCEFIAKLRNLSGGKPVGFKLCIGKRHEFVAICKAIHQTQIYPDYIAIDGSEGGTGAAPLEFSNYIGYPLIEGLIFTHNVLNGFGLRNKIRVGASGKVTSGFGMLRRMSIGADFIYSARGMMLALGCIQAIQCNTNTCPTGITTQDPGLMVGLVVAEKNKRVAAFHRNTVKSLSQILGAMGLKHPSELRPWHLMRRIDGTHIQHYARIYDFIPEGSLLGNDIPEGYREAFQAASAETFERRDRN